jgi:hypothetical protein
VRFSLPPTLPSFPLAWMHIDSFVPHGPSHWLARVLLPDWYPFAPHCPYLPIGSHSGQFAPVPVYSLNNQHTQHSLLRFSSRKMELIPGSETSTHLTQIPGKYPEDNTLHQQHGESLKTKNVCNLFPNGICYSTKTAVTHNSLNCISNCCLVI